GPPLYPATIASSPAMAARTARRSRPRLAEDRRPPADDLAQERQPEEHEPEDPHPDRADPDEAVAGQGRHGAQGDRDLEEGHGVGEAVVAVEEVVGLGGLFVPLLLLLPRLLLDLLLF